MTLDTQVFGDAAACRATGEWMKQAAGNVTDAGTALHRVRTDSETLWRGEAGDAFRGHIGKGGQDADELSHAVTSAGNAVIDFSGDLETVKSRIRQTRQVASAEGLTVTQTGIEPPGPAPTAPQGALGSDSDPGSLAVIRQHADAVAAHERKVAAWREVQTTVGDARSLERGAQETLARKIREHGTFMESLRNGSKFLIADLATGTAGALHKNATRWGKTSGQLRSVANTARHLANNPTMSAAGRARATQIALQRSAAARGVHSNARLLGPLDNNRFGRRLLTGMGREFAGWVPDGGGLTRGAARVLGKVPVVGTGITVGQTYTDIRGGKPADQAIASSATGLAAGSAASGVGMLLAGSAAGGPVTFGIVAAGVGIGMGASYLVDKHWDEIEGAAGAVGDAAGDAWQGTRNLFGKVF